MPFRPYLYASPTTVDRLSDASTFQDYAAGAIADNPAPDPPTPEQQASAFSDWAQPIVDQQPPDPAIPPKATGDADQGIGLEPQRPGPLLPEEPAPQQDDTGPNAARRFTDWLGQQAGYLGVGMEAQAKEQYPETSMPGSATPYVEQNPVQQAYSRVQQLAGPGMNMSDVANQGLAGALLTPFPGPGPAIGPAMGLAAVQARRAAGAVAETLPAVGAMADEPIYQGSFGALRRSLTDIPGYHFTSDPELAKAFAGRLGGKVVHERYLIPGTKLIDYESPEYQAILSGPRMSDRQIMQELQNRGYDGIRIKADTAPIPSNASALDRRELAADGYVLFSEKSLSRSPTTALNRLGAKLAEEGGFARFSAAQRAAKKTETLVDGFGGDPDIMRITRPFVENLAQEAEQMRGRRIPIDTMFRESSTPEAMAEALAWKSGKPLSRQGQGALAFLYNRTAKAAGEIKTALEAKTIPGADVAAQTAKAQELESTAQALWYKNLTSIAEPARALRFHQELKKIALDGVMGVNQPLEQQTRTILGDWLYAALLSSPQTWERNILSNAENIAMELARTSIQNPKTAGPAIQGAAAGIPDGFRAAITMLQKGILPEGDIYGEGLKFSSGGVTATNPIHKGIQVVGEGISMIMGAGDIVARHVGGEMGRYIYAAEQAKRKGTRFAKEVGDVTPGMIDAMKNMARDVTVSQDPGPRMQAALRFREAATIPGTKMTPEIPVGRYIVPFATIPINVFQRGLRYSPIGILRLFWDWQNRGKITAEAVAGAALPAALGLLIGPENLTGPAPRNTNARERFFNTEHKQPWSIKVGGSWLNYTNIIGIGETLGLIGMWNAANEAAKNDEELRAIDDGIAGRFGYLMENIGRFYSDKTFISGINNMLQVFSGDNPGNYLNRLVAGWTVPSGVRWAERLSDETLRDPQNIWEQVLTGIPGASANVQPQITNLGQEAQTATAGWRQMLSPELRPIPSGPQTASEQTITEANAMPGIMQASQRGQRFQGQELVGARKESGLGFDQMLQEINQRPGFQSLQKETRRDIVTALNASAHSLAVPTALVSALQRTNPEAASVVQDFYATPRHFGFSPEHETAYTIANALVTAFEAQEKAEGKHILNKGKVLSDAIKAGLITGKEASLVSAARENPKRTYLRQKYPEYAQYLQ